ncbi:nuclear pore complex protein NUP54 isoform X1 [Amborella trichopoda]|uniref:Nucleoporin Nup54 alpha-helical domain-containing protein n=1 Tax=Amborella trichopoda TaxID=13333 RepID=W1PRX5_AMBTC|nr:nuclear pore complex protein NUP54 isoform X1 [Amborella trichopoda]ERN10010.1 hypothetical protein AMTR_s00013p00234790 [Amborella trichopoda]|eukprot:XP_006848429.1 nuclear pore complex protein NUP54 isoform X1 [Amborella trichopoda]
MFGQTGASAPAFGFGGAIPSTPSFTTPNAPAFGSSLFSTPATAATNASPFQMSQQPSPFSQPQLTTQMAPISPLPFSMADRDIQGIVDAYKDEPGNPKYAFKHLLFSVTDPSMRVKPVGISDIMWAEAMAKLEGMESSDRERLWPQLVQGFKDLSQRLKLQDEALVSDVERLRTTQTNVKLLERHFQVDTLPWIQRMRQKEQGLQRRLLRVMRIVEALEGKGFRVPLMKNEAQLAEKLAGLVKQLKGAGAELPRRVHNLLAVSRMQENGMTGASVSVYLPSSAKIQEQSQADMQEVLQQQTEAIARLGNVLKRDMRNMEIIMSEDTKMEEEASQS